MKAKYFNLCAGVVAVCLSIAALSNAAIATMTKAGCIGAVMVDGQDGIIINRPPPRYVCVPTAVRRTATPRR